MRFAAAAMALAVGATLAPSAHAQDSAAGSVSPPGPADPTARLTADGPQDGGSEAVSSAMYTGDDFDAGAGARPAHDPLEGLNRGIFSFNEAIDKAAIEPIAKGYRAVTPRFFRTGVGNFLHNLRSPVIFANDVLQASPGRAGATLGRFALNSTVGVLGVFDVAGHIGLEDHEEDFGQTLGKWGIGDGPYLMLPLLGPSNLRDLTGKIVDIAIDPITYADFKHDDTARAVRAGAELLTARTDAIGAIESMRQTAIDPYATTRSVYGQARASAIANGEPSAEDSPESDETLSR